VAAVWRAQPPLTRITRMPAGGQREPLAEGSARLEPVTVRAAGEAMAGTERRLAGRDTEGVPERPRRRYGTRPAPGRVARARRVTAVVARRAVAGAVRRLGWRV
jgi:hypothetical protein